ncbi:uncharacterized protein METZ01_LOCUS359983 [marine metagenome]|uniref:Uncharacterized protein n=1 Tax=marine metagenome TaxID=408172 RepID=A0A382SB78_9ZZZZ
MIKIVRNPNFPEWLEIFNGRTLIKEVQGRAKAVRIAEKLAKKQGDAMFLFEDRTIDTE